MCQCVSVSVRVYVFSVSVRLVKKQDDRMVRLIDKMGGCWFRPREEQRRVSIATARDTSLSDFFTRLKNAKLARVYIPLETFVRIRYGSIRRDSVICTTAKRWVDVRRGRGDRLSRAGHR